MTRMERIARYERMLDRAEQAARQMEEARRACADVQNDLKELEQYYTSDEWKEDFRADEEGLLPADLKRGVLSEDGIDSVLERFRELRQRRVRTSAKALVIRDGCMLAVKLQDSDGVFYIMPGGGQQAGELLPAAVEREVAEETGIKVKAGDAVFVIEGAEGEPDHRVDIVFRCEYEGPCDAEFQPDRRGMAENRHAEHGAAVPVETAAADHEPLRRENGACLSRKRECRRSGDHRLKSCGRRKGERNT